MDNSRQHPIKTFLPYILPLVLVLSLVLFLLTFRSEIAKFLNNNALTDFDSMTISDGFQGISLPDGRSWKVAFEKNPSQSFSGMVGHISPIRSGAFAVLSHDLLIITGDFQDSSLVSIRVSNHHFSWRSKTDQRPKGSIHLLHTLPKDQEIFMKLKQLKTGDIVTLKGFEIYRLDGWNSSNQYVGYWKDSGCNTILVKEVIVE